VLVHTSVSGNSGEDSGTRTIYERGTLGYAERVCLSGAEIRNSAGGVIKKGRGEGVGRQATEEGDAQTGKNEQTGEGGDGQKEV
jgi:hypothetical protein